MKKFSSMLALGMALAMTLGMTVCAAPSTNTEDSNVTSEALAEVAAQSSAKAEGSDVAVAVEAVTVDTYNEAVAEVESVTAKISAAGVTTNEGVKLEKIVSITAVVDVVIPAQTVIPAEGLKVTLSVPGVDSGKQYVALHQKADGTWEILDAVVNGNGVTVTFKSLSPVAVVEVVKAGTTTADEDDDDDDDAEQASAVATDGTAVSPKTGETVPAAAVMAIVCLAGAAFCTKKVRLNQ